MLSPLIAHFDLAGRLPLLILYLLLNLMAYPLLRHKTALPLLWRLFGNAGQEMARRLNRSSLSERDLRQRGRVLIVILLALAAMIAFAVIALTEYPFGWIAQLLLLAASINALLPVALLRQPITQKEPETERRQAIMTAADHFCRHVMAPIFFFTIAGPLGLTLSVALLSVIEMKRQAAEIKDVFFYAPLRRLNRVVMLVPTWCAVICSAFAGIFVSRAHPLRGIALLNKAAWYDSFGVIVAHIAGVLGITLGGPVRDIYGDVFMRNWIGPKESSARIDEIDRNRAALLFTISFVLIIGGLSGVLIVKNIFT